MNKAREDVHVSRRSPDTKRPPSGGGQPCKSCRPRNQNQQKASLLLSRGSRQTSARQRSKELPPTTIAVHWNCSIQPREKDQSAPLAPWLNGFLSYDGSQVRCSHDMRFRDYVPLQSPHSQLPLLTLRLQLLPLLSKSPFRCSLHKTLCQGIHRIDHCNHPALS